MLFHFKSHWVFLAHPVYHIHIQQFLSLEQFILGLFSWDVILKELQKNLVTLNTNKFRTPNETYQVFM
jgi:hypothetical protein